MTAPTGLAVVLVHSDGAQNVGSVARLCGNFGVELRLVAPRADLHCRDALKMAHPCEATLLALTPHATLAEAVADCDLRLATSGKIALAMDAAPLDVRRAGLLLPEPGARLALVFGNERTGLAVADAALCERVVRLPTPGPVDSLNLASAVAVALTLFAEAARGPVAGRASADARERLAAAFADLFAGVLGDARAQAAFAPRIDELVGKMDLSRRDVALLTQLLERVRP